MAEPKKNTIKNTLKEDVSEGKSAAKETKAKKEKSAETDSDKISLLNRINNFFSFLRNEQFQRIFGLTLLLFSAYLAISFTSFAFTWKADQDKVLGDLFSPDVSVSNWLGKFGALLSHVFIHKWFGAASYIFSFLALLTGLRITFNLELVNLRKAYAYSFFFLIFISVTLGFVFSDAFFYLGGSFGYTISNKLNAILGHVGTGVLLVFSLVVFIVAAFNVSFDLSKKDPITDEGEPDPTPDDEKKNVLNSFKEE